MATWGRPVEAVADAGGTSAVAAAPATGLLAPVLRRKVAWFRAVALTVAVGVLGWGTDRLARLGGATFPSYRMAAAIVVWKIGTLLLLAFAVYRTTGRTVTLRDIGYRRDPTVTRLKLRQRSRRAVVGLVAGAAVSVAIGAVAPSATSGSSFGPVHRASLLLAAVVLLVQYPLTVFAEEAMFRGWLQRRLAPAGLLASAILWPGQHLQQWQTIPSLIGFGLILGVIRWWTGDVRATSLLHYLSDAIFFVGTYL